MKSAYTWELVVELASGHRLWRDGYTRKLAIADRSGDFSGRKGRPDQTEDGILWLTDEPAVLEFWNFGPVVSVPVRNGAESDSVVSVELADVSTLVGLGIKVIVSGEERTQRLVRAWRAAFAALDAPPKPAPFNGCRSCGGRGITPESSNVWNTRKCPECGCTPGYGSPAG